jgi:hypothetical protein
MLVLRCQQPGAYSNTLPPLHRAVLGCAQKSSSKTHILFKNFLPHHLEVRLLVQPCQRTQEMALCPVKCWVMLTTQAARIDAGWVAVMVPIHLSSHLNGALSVPSCGDAHRPYS